MGVVDNGGWGRGETKKKKFKKEKRERKKERDEGRVHSKEIDGWFVSKGVGVVKKSPKKR